MALVLSIETSTSVCSVALHQTGKLVATLEIHEDFSHAAKLGLLVDNVIKLADIKIRDIGAIAVSSGPGSYTGLRIGTSLAKGLCYAWDVPLISVPTLQMMAAYVGSFNTADAFLCPMIDARRMEVYCHIFDFNLEETEPVHAKVIDDKSFDAQLSIKPVIFFGNGSMKCREVIIHENAKFLTDVNPSAAQMGELAYGRFEQGLVEDLVQFAPLYLKEFFIKKPTAV